MQPVFNEFNDDLMMAVLACIISINYVRTVWLSFSLALHKNISSVLSEHLEILFWDLTNQDFVVIQIDDKVIKSVIEESKLFCRWETLLIVVLLRRTKMLSMFSFDVSTTRHKPLIFTTYVYCLLHHCTHTLSILYSIHFQLRNNLYRVPL